MAFWGRDEVSHLVGTFFTMVAPTALFSLYPTPETEKGKLVMESAYRMDVGVLLSSHVWRPFSFVFFRRLSSQGMLGKLSQVRFPKEQTG